MLYTMMVLGSNLIPLFHVQHLRARTNTYSMIYRVTVDELKENLAKEKEEEMQLEKELKDIIGTNGVYSNTHETCIADISQSTGVLCL